MEERISELEVRLDESEVVIRRLLSLANGGRYLGDTGLHNAISQGRPIGCVGASPYKVITRSSGYQVSDALGSEFVFSYRPVTFDDYESAALAAAALNASARYDDILTYLREHGIGQYVFLNRYPEQPTISDPILAAKLQGPNSKEDKALLLRLMETAWPSQYKYWINRASKDVRLDQLIGKEAKKLNYFFYTYLVSDGAAPIRKLIQKDSAVDSINEELSWAGKKQGNPFSENQIVYLLDAVTSVINRVGEIYREWEHERRAHLTAGKLAS